MNAKPKLYLDGGLRVTPFSNPRDGMWLECEVTTTSWAGRSIHVYFDEDACLRLFLELRKQQARVRSQHDRGDDESGRLGPPPTL